MAERIDHALAQPAAIPGIMELALQSIIPTDVVQMIPFAMVMIVLVLFARRAHLPAALGLPYQRGAR